MSANYAIVALKAMVPRLRELSQASADQRWSEFSMRVPADPERDADLVLVRAAELISCLETPADPASTDVHYQSARAAAEAVAHDAFERAGGEPPQPQPVTREHFNELVAMVGDIANTLGRERVVERLSQLEAMTLDKRIDGLRARLDGQRIAGDDLASRVAALEKLTDLETWRELADAHAVAARALHARVRKLGSGTGGAP